jgi:hypothetical protein
MTRDEIIQLIVEKAEKEGIDLSSMGIDDVEDIIDSALTFFLDNLEDVTIGEELPDIDFDELEEFEY